MTPQLEDELVCVKNVRVSMNKVAVLISVDVDDGTAELVI